MLVPLALLVGAFFLVSRSETRPAPPPAPPPVVVFTPTFEHLPPVLDGHYEVWAEQPDGGTARLAAFAVLPGGALTTLAGEPVLAFPVDAVPPPGTTFAVTVEEGLRAADARGERILLRGVSAGADVTFEPVLPDQDGDQRALLQVATDSAAPKTAGLWFATTTGDRSAVRPGLRLPPAAAGFVYGGFVTTAGGTVLTTGSFTDPRAADNASSYSGQGRGLPLPGEDFLRNSPEGVTFPPNLADGRTEAIVALLPDFAAEAAEPYLPLLTARVAYQQKAGAAFELQPVPSDQLPRGSGKFEERPS